jgi:hypothetical protein
MATRCAKRHVEMDSSVCDASATMVATMTVWQFPPRLSRSISVITELRYGTCERLPVPCCGEVQQALA